MENPPAISKNALGLSKTEQIKFQSFEDKLQHYDPHSPFLAILGANTDSLINAFSKYINAIFKGKTVDVPYSKIFDLSTIADKYPTGLLIVRLQHEVASNKKEIADNFLFYRDIVKEKNMKLVVLCNTEIFNELQLKATDFVSMALDANQFVDLRVAKEGDLKESDTLIVAERELQKNIAALDRYKKFEVVNKQVLLEWFRRIIDETYSISNFNICLQFSYELLEYARLVNAEFYEMLAYGGLGMSSFSLGLYSQALGYTNEAIRKATLLGNIQNEIGYQNNLGNIYLEMGNLDLTKVCYTKALSMAESVADYGLEATVIDNLGNLARTTGKFNQSVIFFNKALLLFKKVIKEGDRNGMIRMGHVYSNLGGCYRDKGDNKLALSSYNTALNIARKFNDMRQVIDNLNAIGNIAFSTGGYFDALEYFMKGKEISERIGDIKGQTSSCRNIGGVYRQCENWHEAYSFLMEAKLLAEKLNSPGEYISVYLSLGQLERERGNLASAIYYINMAYEISDKIDSIPGVITSLLEMSKISFSNKNYNEAKINLSKALELQKEDGFQVYELYILSFLSDILLIEGNYPESLRICTEILPDFRKIQDVEDQIETLIRIFILYSKFNESKNAIRYLNEAKAMASAMDNKEKQFRNIEKAEKQVAELVA